MAYQEVFRVDTRELIRLWQKGLSQRRIARISGRARDTVRRYVNRRQGARFRTRRPRSH